MQVSDRNCKTQYSINSNFIYKIKRQLRRNTGSQPSRFTGKKHAYTCYERLQLRSNTLVIYVYIKVHAPEVVIIVQKGGWRAILFHNLLVFTNLP